MELLRCDQVSYFNEGRYLFYKVSLLLHSGELIILRGSNGSGKTTFLNCLCGTQCFSSGKVAQRAPIKSSSLGRHFLYAHFGTFDIYTVEEQLSYYARMFGYPKNDIPRILHLCGLQARSKVPISCLSEGQKKRLAMSRLLFQDSLVWVLDEPESGLDGETLGWFRLLVEYHRSLGGSVIMASHSNLQMFNSLSIHFS
uniref:Cytochrome C biogenesis protein CcmA n=1 Tax=Ophirina amphinema TaxID=2108040 RepID=A0A348AYV0_9EUKA|nr:cytochrome C biogenesis protein CcmA [Ophirina amphinema]